MSTRYLKAPNPPTTEATDELRARVSEILRDIERDGIDAVRRYSEEFDAWAPADFVVSDAEYRARRAELDDDLKGHIAFAQEQVRGLRPRPARHAARSRSRRCRASCSATATSRSAPSGPTCPAAATRCSPPPS